MEKTLIILKPDAFEKRKVGATLTRFEEAGFNIIAAKMVQFDPDLLREHYAHVTGFPFYSRLETFMSIRPLMVLIIEGPAAIARVRRLIGPTDSQVAPAGTIRGDWGTNSMFNIAHSSDSPESAAVEIQRFFAPEEVHA